MIRLDEIRAALVSPAPSKAFDQLARRELRHGSEPKQVHDQIAAFLPVMQEWPEYDGEGREDLQGILDALAGWSHRDRRYVSVLPFSQPARTVSAGSCSVKLEEFPRTPPPKVRQVDFTTRGSRVFNQH